MSNTSADTQHCRAVRSNGDPCKGKPLANSHYCFAHSQSSQEWRAKGGHNRANATRAAKAMPERLRPVADLLSTSMVRTFQGTMKPQQATAIAALASAYVRVVTAGELEQRIAALETAVSA